MTIHEELAELATLHGWKRKREDSDNFWVRGLESITIYFSESWSGRKPYVVFASYEFPSGDVTVLDRKPVMTHTEAHGRGKTEQARQFLATPPHPVIREDVQQLLDRIDSDYGRRS